MKKIYAVAFWLLMIGYAEVAAQNSFFTVTTPLQQGDVLLGGSITGNHSNFDDANSINRQFRMSLSPSIQFFLSDNIIFSLSLPFAYNRNLNENSQPAFLRQTVNSQTSLSPALKFVKPLGDRLYLYAQGYADAGWVFSRSESQPQNQIDTQNQFQLGTGLTGGGTFLINDHFVLECVVVGLSYYWWDLGLDGAAGIRSGSGFWFTPSRPTFSLSYRIRSHK